MKTGRPCREAEISSKSGSSTVKTRTPGRATQRFTVLEVALSCASKINSRKKGLLELHRNPAREAARQASGTDRRSPGACGSWQSFAPFPFFPSTAPETCARASERGGDGGEKIHWLPPRVQGGCSSAPLASHGRREGVFLGGRARGIPSAPEMGTALVGVGEGQWRWGGGDGAEVEQGSGWWSWAKGDGAREEAMDVGRGRGERMGK